MTRFSSRQAWLMMALLLIAGAGAGAVYAEEAAPPAAQPAAGAVEQPPAADPGKDAKPAEGPTPAAGDTKQPAPGGETAPGEKPAQGEAASAPARPELKPGPPLEVAGIGALEMLPRVYEATLRFYVEVLGFREGDASGGEGERRCTLASGPVRLVLREQPGKPILPKRPPWLGVNPALLSEVAAEAAGLKEPKGVLVDDLVPQGPAGVSGITRGDIILAVEGKETASPNDLINTIRGFDVGKKVLVTVWREGKKRDIPVELPASPFPEQLGPVALRLEVRGLDDYYRELLKRGARIYAEPRDTPEGGRVLEMVDPNDLLVVLEEPRSRPEKPAPAAPAAGEGGKEQPPAPPSGEEKPAAPTPAPAR